MAGNDAWVIEESGRVARRRECLGLGAPRKTDASAWGLCLSGGGIRSATFSLGVLQALAKAPAPPFDPPSKSEDATPAVPSGPQSKSDERSEAPRISEPHLLHFFDYLSTVSGGGYVGAFFISLFIPNRLVAAKDLKPAAGTGSDDQQIKSPKTLFTRLSEALRGVKAALAPRESSFDAASRAYQVIANDPPGRIRSGETFDPIRQPLAWLRENGRYLTPTGAGDVIYAIALSVRNWFAVHYVLGTLLLALFALMAMLKAEAAILFGHFFRLEVWAPPVDAADPQLWWSPLWALPLLTAFFWLAPFGVAFWLSHLRGGQTEEPGKFRRAFSLAMWLALAVFAVLCLLANTGPLERFEQLRWLVLAMAAVTGLGVTFHVATAFETNGVEAQRVEETRQLARGLKLALVLAAAAALDTASQTIYLWLMQPGSLVWKFLSPAALLAAAIWLIRKGASAFTEKAAPQWFAWIPLDLIAGIVAAVLLFGIATAWALGLQWVIWKGLPPVAPTDAIFVTQLYWSAATAGVAGFLAVVGGWFPGFINLSTLQSFYSARITRAYLGASNGARFSEEDGQKWRSVAEPHPNDSIARESYYAGDVCSPVHIINVTMNQTVDPAEQLVQRDRKGKPLAVGPAGVLLDGKYRPFSDRQDPLSVGQWIGVSGAAFTTGLGRTTSLGISLVLGLANVRLGTWWRSDLGVDRSSGLERLFLQVLPTQTYLSYEFFANFHGNHRKRQYLSDGGHFENTAAYELLRPERDIRLIVVCDNGCDGKYRFSDLATLIRLIRIDFKARIELVTEFAGSEELAQIFGDDRELREAQAGTSSKCALLFKVTYPEREDLPARHLIVLKPRLIAGAPPDVAEYHQRHAAFPQESTIDQFFDEAQWESYRKLGLEIGTLVFDKNGKSLWRFLLRSEPGAAAAVQPPDHPAQ